MTESEREIRQSGHMSDAEALMWVFESDPWLSSAMGSLLILDGPVDIDRFTHQMDEASRTFVRLRERVDEGLPITTPRWVPDSNFDLANHVTERTLPAPGGVRELLDLTAEVINTPFDREKPLWQFVAVSESRPPVSCTSKVKLSEP